MPLAELRPFLPYILDQIAVVHTRGATGAFDVVFQAALPVRLAQIGSQSATTSEERAELTSLRRLLWAAEVDLPEACRLTVNGEVWQSVPGTLVHARGAITSLQYRSCDVRRVE